MTHVLVPKDIVVRRSKRGKGTGKQGESRHVTGSETASCSIRAAARMN